MISESSFFCPALTAAPDVKAEQTRITKMHIICDTMFDVFRLILVVQVTIQIAQAAQAAHFCDSDLLVRPPRKQVLEFQGSSVIQRYALLCGQMSIPVSCMCAEVEKLLS